MKNNKLKTALIYAQKEFPQEFETILSCVKSNEHDWFIDLSVREEDARLVDVQCKKCKTNLAIALRLFAGIQDHG